MRSDTCCQFESCYYTGTNRAYQALDLMLRCVGLFDNRVKQDGSRETMCEGLRGGPFDTWGGYGFSFGIKLFFSTPSLNVQFFSDLMKSKQFFSQR